METKNTHASKALSQIWSAGRSNDLPDLRAPVQTWLLARSRFLRDPENLDWVRNDPVISPLAPALYALSGRTIKDSMQAACQPFTQIYYINLAWWVKSKNVLDEILMAFFSEGIYAILLKGAAFQYQLYNNSGLCQMADIDLLVKEKDFQKSALLLIDFGFRFFPDYSSIKELSDLNNLQPSSWPTELSFQNENGLLIELHRHLISTNWLISAFSIDIDKVWDRSYAGLSKTDNNFYLSLYDTLAHLCLHEAMHGMQAMRTYLDIDQLIRKLPISWDWNIFTQTVTEWKILSAAYHTLSFCQYFMNTPLPPKLLSQIDPGWIARLRLHWLISAESILQDKKTLGKKYPSLVKLLLIDQLSSIISILISIIFPKQRPTSYLDHWKHAWEVVIRGD